MNFEPGVSLQTPSEVDSLLPLNEDATTITSSFHCKLRYRARTVRSKGAVLVLAWSFLPWYCSSSVDTFLRSVVDMPLGFEVLDGVTRAALCLIAGWLTDVYFGRYKVIRASILLIWLGSVLGTLLLVIHLLHPPSTDALKYVSAVVAYVCVTAGSSGLIVNAVPFGTDQMPGASSDEISAFIHWFAWAVYTGVVSIAIIIHLVSCSGLNGDETNLVSMLFVVAISSVALCLDFLFRKWLIVEPVCQNPLKTVLSVLKYSATHNRPARRSALTYWEDEIPSRMNLGKSKYGGPFTTEQVEDVKTFFRLLTISIAVIVFLYPLNLCISSLGYFFAHFQSLRSLAFNEECYNALIGLFSSDFVIILGVPLYEFAIYPLTRNWIPSTLKRVGISALGTIIVASIALSVDMVGHSHTNATMSLECMFVANTTSNSTVDINYLWFGIPLSIIIGIELLTLFVSLFEFICAQTPYDMKGLIIGLGFCALALSDALTGASLLTWVHAWLQPPTYPTCTFWFYLFVILVTVVSLVIFCIMAKWYKKRERNELLHQQRFVEDFYDKYI